MTVTFQALGEKYRCRNTPGVFSTTDRKMVKYFPTFYSRKSKKHNPPSRKRIWADITPTTKQKKDILCFCFLSVKQATLTSKEAEAAGTSDKHLETDVEIKKMLNEPNGCEKQITVYLLIISCDQATQLLILILKVLPQVKLYTN